MDNNRTLQQEVGFHLTRRQAEVEVLYNGQELQSLHIEFNSTEDSLKDPTYEEQVALEEEMQLVGVKKFLKSQEKLERSGSGSQTSSLRRMRRDAIPATVEEIKSRIHRLQNEVYEVDESCEPNTLAAITRLMRLVEPEAMAMITIDRILDGIPVGGKTRTSADVLCKQIGHAIDYEAFMAYLVDYDPRLSRVIAQYYTKNDAMNRDRKIRASIDFIDKQSIDISWDWLSDADRQRVGHFLVQSAIRGTGLFVEERVYKLNENGGELKTPYVINLGDVGQHERERFERIALEGVSQNWPMIIPPVPHNKDCTQGGYLEVRVGANNSALHNNQGGSIPDQAAVDAINNLQNQAWQVNEWILVLQEELAKQTRKVGKFKPFDEATYKEQQGLTEIPEEIWKLDRKDLVRRRAIAEHLEAIRNMKKRENLGTSAFRTLSIARRFAKYKRIYTGWYFDSRLRMYPVCDTLSPQGADYAKALMQFADGTPVTPESLQELLVSIGTTYGHGVDKRSFKDRIAFAEDILKPRFKALAENPLDSIQFDFWSNAEEPFQFLALIHEYVAVTREVNPQKTHHVSAGRDATCSGIQLAGAILLDEATCRLVNVLPADKPQDAYAAVAEEAVKLLKDEQWLKEAIDSREAAKQKRFKKRLAEQELAVKEGKMEEVTTKYEPCYEFNVPLEKIDRTVAKMICMLTPYGGTFPTMLGHVREKLADKKGHECENGDDIIVTKALIKGMELALPGYSNVNAWFRSLAQTCLKQGGEQITWVTPNGSVVKQEYREDERKTVRTAVHGVAKVGSGKRRRQYQVLNGKVGAVKNSKMQTALAANAIHSLDGCVIQMAVHDYEETPFSAVHDCVYAPSGGLGPLVERIRSAFRNVVTSNFLESLIEENELDDFECLPKGTADISEVIHSEYLFS